MPVEDLDSKAVDPSVEFAGYICWRFPALKLQIFIDPVLYRATVNAALLAGKAKRSSEIGGILLGSVIQSKNTQSIVVNEINAVASEGRLFNATVKDASALQTALQRTVDSKFRPVGSFRSHLRKELTVSNEDWDFFARYMGTAPALFLVMKPEGNTSCLPQFYFWHEGRSLQTATGELLRESVSAGPFAQIHEESIAPHSPMVPPAFQTPQFNVPREEREEDEDPFWTRGHLAAIALLVIACFVGFLCRPFIQNYMHGSSGSGNTTLIALHAERGPGGQLNLSWNRGLPSLSAGQTANLTILDGPYHRDVAIDPEQLRFGRLTYFAQTDDVQFRFEISLGDDRSLAENLHVIAPGYVAPISNGIPLTDLPPRQDFTSRRRDGYRPGNDPVKRLNGNALNHDDSAKPLPSVPSAAAIVKDPAGAAVAGDGSNGKVLTTQANTAAPAPSLEKINGPEIAWNGGSQTFEIHNPLPATAPPPAVETVPATVTPEPLVHRTAATRVPPRPIRQVLPNTKLFGRSLVRDVVTLQVAVVIDEQGVVTTARALNPKAVGSFLAAQAVSAARDWKFEPAQIGGQNAASTYTILFRFHP